MSRVLTTITAQDIDRHRETLIAWAEENGLDPWAVAQRPGLTIEQAGKRTVICYRELQWDEQGRPLVDPDHPGEALTISRSTPLKVPLPDLPAEASTTPGDETPGGGPPS